MTEICPWKWNGRGLGQWPRIDLARMIRAWGAVGQPGSIRRKNHVVENGPAQVNVRSEVDVQDPQWAVFRLQGAPKGE